MILGLLIGVHDYYLYKLELTPKSAMMQTYSGTLNEDDLFSVEDFNIILNFLLFGIEDQR